MGTVRRLRITSPIMSCSLRRVSSRLGLRAPCTHTTDNPAPAGGAQRESRVITRTGEPMKVREEERASKLLGGRLAYCAAIGCVQAQQHAVRLAHRSREVGENTSGNGARLGPLHEGLCGSREFRTRDLRNRHIRSVAMHMTRWRERILRIRRRAGSGERREGLNRHTVEGAIPKSVK